MKFRMNIRWQHPIYLRLWHSAETGNLGRNFGFRVSERLEKEGTLTEWMLKEWNQRAQQLGCFPPRRWRCCGVTKGRCLQFGSTRMANTVWAVARTAPCGYGTHTRVCTSRLIPVTLAMFVTWLSQGNPLVAKPVIAIASWIKKCLYKFPEF